MKINNDFQRFSRSSKNVNFANIKDKIEKIPKININDTYLVQPDNANRLINNSPQPNQSMSIHNISVNEPTFQKSKRLNNMNITYINHPKKNNNLLHPNYLFLPKQNNLNRSKLSINDGFHKQKSKKTIIDAINQPMYEHSSKTNLKLVQKELQYKLLDMSIQIENNMEQDDDNSNFSSLKNDKTNNFWGRNVKKELESYKNEIKVRRSSATINDIAKFQELINANRSINKGYNRCQTNKYLLNNNNMNHQNITLFRNDLNKTNISVNKNNRRKSFNLNRNNNGINRNNISFNFLNMNNKSMYINRNTNTIMSKNNLSMNMHNKSTYINSNNISINKLILNSIQHKEYENKYRIVYRTKELYDSYEDEEVVEEMEEEYYFISPETHKIFIFDVFNLFCILFCSFFYPIHIAQSICFCSIIPNGIIIILFFTDLINIIDILISFFRAYYNFEFVLVKKNEKIIKHYLKRYFIPDIISAIPIFSCSYYLCEKFNPDSKLCFTNGIDLKYNCLKMCLGLKIIKLFKVLDRKSNRGINYFYDKISENYTLEKTMKMALFGLMCVLGFNIFICYHIFIGRQNYPNWILATNNQDKNFLNLYMISCYFLITTITSVGYGDITCVSLGETIFQIILLTIGVIAYSWVVSTIGNYVKKETRAAIKYNKDMDLLEEIRISYPKMSFKLYNKIQKHLETVSQQQERFDTNLLVNTLPYTLKNQLMFIIYGNIIKKFNFFKECENSDFILRILTSFIPMTAKKGAFIIHEGELVDNIIFVKEGRLSLIAAIDLDNPLISIDNYLGEKFEDINEKMDTKLDNSAINKSMNLGLKIEKAQTEIRTFLKTKDELNNSNIEQEIAKLDYDGDDFEVGNHQFLNILDILKNEHYGEVYMFLQKPSPLSLRVKSKYSQLFLLRKHEAMMISKAYPNVWKKIYQKSYHNMKSIKKLTKKIVIHYCQNYGHKYDSRKGVDILRHDSENFIVNLGLLNSKKRRNKKSVNFNLNGSFSDKKVKVELGNYPKKKTILKNVRKTNSFEKIPEEINKSNYRDNNSPLHKESVNKNGFVIQINGRQMNQMDQMSKMRTLNSNFRSNKLLTINSDSKFSQTINPNVKNQSKKNLKTKYSNDILFKNKLSNKISLNNINSNNNNKNDDLNKTIDLKNTKVFSNFEDKNMTLSNNFLRKMNSNVAVKSNSILFKSKEKMDSNCISSLSFKGKIQNNAEKNNSEITDTKILQGSNLKNSILTQRVLGTNEIVNKTPNTIKNLSRPLIKKIQKKIKKRRQKKKLYKMLISKISESLIKVNPNSNINFNLNSSINNSFNNLIIKNDNNNNMPYGLQTSYILQDNSIASDRIDINEGLVNPINGQELLIIPESPEFDSESSSENSKSSNDSNTITLEEKKKIELSISENFNFSYSTTYENMDSISEGNYSKDINLRKSVLKLIGVYLKEKLKNKNKSNIKNEDSEKNLINKKDKEKDKEKEKEKEKINTKVSKKEKNVANTNKDENKENDVWAFLNDDVPGEDLKFNLGSPVSKNDSFLEGKNYSKTPKNKIKRNIDFTGAAKAKSRFKKNFSIINGEKDQFESFSPKVRKKITKKKTKKDSLELKKCTTIINQKKKKKNSVKNEKFVSNKEVKLGKILHKKEKNSNNNTILSSLDLSLNDNFDHQNSFRNISSKIKKKENDIDCDSKNGFKDGSFS